MEAAWRILQFNLHGKTINEKFLSHVTESYTGQKPNVVPLQIHLPHEQQIMFDPSANAAHIVECGENADTPLMAFFKANQLPGPTGDLAQTLTYQEFPNHFVIKASPSNLQSKEWHHRQRESFAIGRMVYVGPTARERFHL